MTIIEAPWNIEPAASKNNCLDLSGVTHIHIRVEIFVTMQWTSAHSSHRFLATSCTTSRSRSIRAVRPATSAARTASAMHDTLHGRRAIRRARAHRRGCAPDIAGTKTTGRKQDNAAWKCSDRKRWSTRCLRAERSRWKNVRLQTCNSENTWPRINRHSDFYRLTNGLAYVGTDFTCVQIDIAFTNDQRRATQSGI